MSLNSILPPAPVDFWIKRCFFGTILSSSLIGYGICSIGMEHSYAIGVLDRKINFVEVFGFQAILTGVAYIGLGLALFSHCYASYSERLSSLSRYGVALGLFLAMFGTTWGSWMLLAE